MTAHKNPNAAIWAEAEQRLVQQIQAIHELGVSVDTSRQHLHWQGGSHGRFQQRAHVYHEQLHQTNDMLRWALKLVRMAADVPIPQPKHHPAGKGAAA